MKATLATPTVTFELEAATPKELFKLIAETQEVFGERHCGRCGSEDLRFVCRSVDSHDFYEQVCESCTAKLVFGQSKQRTGHIFPVRKLDRDGKPSWKDGEPSDTNGWTLYRGQASDEEQPTPPAGPAQQQQPQNGASNIPATLKDLRDRIAAKERELMMDGRVKPGELFAIAKAGAGKEWNLPWDANDVKKAYQFVASFLRSKQGAAA